MRHVSRTCWQRLLTFRQQVWPPLVKSRPRSSFRPRRSAGLGAHRRHRAVRPHVPVSARARSGRPRRRRRARPGSGPCSGGSTPGPVRAPQRAGGGLERGASTTSFVPLQTAPGNKPLRARRGSAFVDFNGIDHRRSSGAAPHRPRRAAAHARPRDRAHGASAPRRVALLGRPDARPVADAVRGSKRVLG